MISNNDFARISALDLNPIKTKLMHVESGESWSQAYATAVETEYRRFLYLAKAFPNEQVAPLDDVDTFWHYHILDTMKYARDCEDVFGYFMHHHPYLGMAGEDGSEEREHAGKRMRELYESTFNLSYQRVADPGASAGAVETAWCMGTGGPGIAKAAAVQSAWCVSPGTGAKATAVKTAYCIGPGVKAAAVTTAYCIGVPQPA